MWVSVLSVLAAVPLATPLLATFESPSWRTRPPSSRDLHIALKPHRKNALIDALYEVGDPNAHLPKEQVAQRPRTLELHRDAETARPLYFSSCAAGSGGTAWLQRLGVEFSEAHLYSTVPRLSQLHPWPAEHPVKTIGTSYGDNEK